MTDSKNNAEQQKKTDEIVAQEPNIINPPREEIYKVFAGGSVYAGGMTVDRMFIENPLEYELIEMIYDPYGDWQELMETSFGNMWLYRATSHLEENDWIFVPTVPKSQWHRSFAFRNKDGDLFSVDGVPMTEDDLLS